MHRLSHLALEEIVSAGLLALLLVFIAMRPGVVTQRFDTPYATPAPGGGAARRLVPESRPLPSPGPFLIFQRELTRP